jgi:hypothetical protein
MKNYVKSLQKALVFLLSTVLLFSCNQIETFEGPDLSEAQARIPVNLKSTDPNFRIGKDFIGNYCNDVTHKLMAGKNTPIGEVTVFNSDDKFYVTVSIEKGDGFDDGDWFITKIHAFFGEVKYDFEARGKKGIRNPAPGQFPINEPIEVDYTVADQEFTYELEITEYLRSMGAFDVAVHAEVVRIEGLKEENGVYTGKAVQWEGAWAGDQEFNPDNIGGNWALYMSYKIVDCDDSCDRTWTRVIFTDTTPPFINFEDIDDAATTIDDRVFNITGGNRTVGKAQYKVDLNRERGTVVSADISITFSIREELKGEFSFEEFSAYLTSAGSIPNSDLFVPKMKKTPDGGVIEFKEIPIAQATNNNFYVALLAKINGPCLPD